MKVLHLHNTAGVASMISNGLKELGVQSDVLMTSNPYNNDCDYYYNINGNIIKKANVIKTIIQTGKKYDIIHTHSGLRKNRFDIKVLKQVYKKPIVVHYHGSETRIGYGMFHQNWADVKIVSTPDLLDYHNDAIHIPCSTTLREYNWSIGGKLKFLHITNKDDSKGKETIQKAFNKINQNNNATLEIKKNLSWKRVLTEINKSDIIIDAVEKEIGFYGVISLEAMSMGKIPICYIKPKYRKRHLPIISPEYATVSSLGSCLSQLINESYALKNKSILCYDYIKNELSCRTIAEKYLKIYEELIN